MIGLAWSLVRPVYSGRHSWSRAGHCCRSHAHAGCCIFRVLTCNVSRAWQGSGAALHAQCAPCVRAHRQAQLTMCACLAGVCALAVCVCSSRCVPALQVYARLRSAFAAHRADLQGKSAAGVWVRACAMCKSEGTGEEGSRTCMAEVNPWRAATCVCVCVCAAPKSTQMCAPEPIV